LTQRKKRLQIRANRIPIGPGSDPRRPTLDD